MSAQIPAPQIAPGTDGYVLQTVGGKTLWVPPGDVVEAAYPPGTDGQVLTVQSDGSLAWETPPGGGGSSGDMVRIAGNELATAAATITFSSIPGTYRHLRLILTARSDASATLDTVKLFANSDTTLANYKYKHFYGTTITGYNAGADAQVGFAPGNTATASEAGSMEILLPHYAKTTYRKVFQSQFYTPGTPASGVANVVRLNTAAITDLTLDLATGQFMAGTCATLYGLA